MSTFFSYSVVRYARFVGDGLALAARARGPAGAGTAGLVRVSPPSTPCALVRWVQLSKTQEAEGDTGKQAKRKPKTKSQKTFAHKHTSHSRPQLSPVHRMMTPHTPVTATAPQGLYCTLVSDISHPL